MVLRWSVFPPAKTILVLLGLMAKEFRLVTLGSGFPRSASIEAPKASRKIGGDEELVEIFEDRLTMLSGAIGIWIRSSGIVQCAPLSMLFGDSLPRQASVENTGT